MSNTNKNPDIQFGIVPGCFAIGLFLVSVGLLALWLSL